MKAKYTDQQFQRGKETHKTKEKARNLDKDLWSTTYLTDMPDTIKTDEAESKVKEFIFKHFGSTEAPDEEHFPAVLGFTIARNGMFKMWQFTVVTTFEVTEFEIIEETDEERRERLMPIAKKWWDKYGSLDDEYQDYDWSIYDVIEKDEGNTIIINLSCAVGGSSEVLKRNSEGKFEWIRNN